MSSTNNSPKKINTQAVVVNNSTQSGNVNFNVVSSVVVNNSTQSGNVNFNVVSNRVKNQPSSLSSD